MTMKMYSTFPKAPGLFDVISKALIGDLSAEMQAVYSTVSADKADITIS